MNLCSACKSPICHCYEAERTILSAENVAFAVFLWFAVVAIGVWVCL